MEPIEVVNIGKWSQGRWQTETDVVVREIVASIYLNNTELVRLHCSPGYLDDLAVGHLAGYGIVQMKDDIISLNCDFENATIKIEVPEHKLVGKIQDRVDTITSSSGRSPSFHLRRQKLPSITSTASYDPWEIVSLMEELHEMSELFKQTGGVHSAGLGESGTLAAYRQDIGRHNAVDKVIGHCILNGVDVSTKALIISGRISADIVLKAASCKLAVLVSPSAPTALAIQTASSLGITVIGFVRGQRLSVYSQNWRLQQ